MTPEEQKLVDESFTHMDLKSKDLVAERIEQLKTLFPEITVEGDGTIDFEKLRIILGDEVDEGQERYAFTWPGKADAIRQAQTPSTATLRPDEAASVNWDTTENLYIEGDNLEVLKLLQRGYHGKVKMIYIDPPYNTGHDFVYKDTFKNSIENYREQAGLMNQTNADASGSYHSSWLSMMYPRLKLARELLTDDGLLFISINDVEQVNLEKLCDELFGIENKVMTFVWKNKYGPGALTKGAASLHEYVLCYAKNYPNNLESELSEEEMTKYKTFDSKQATRGGYITQPLATKSKDDRPNLVYPLIHEGKEIWPDKQWIWSKDRLYEAYEKDELVINEKDGKYSVRFKQYLKDENGRIRKGKPLSLLTGFFNQDGTKEIEALFGSRVFDFPKPSKLIRDFLAYRVNEIDDDSFIVMDFFSGSAPTADAVMQLNAEDGGHRRYILVQLPENTPEKSLAFKHGYQNLCEIGEDRIRLAGQKIKAEIEESNQQLRLDGSLRKVPDIGFRVLKLDSSNFEQVADGALIDDLIKPGRNNDDIIFEMMLKWGLELSLPMEKTEVAGYPITSIAADELICCMDEGLTVEVLEVIAALEPKRVFFLDSVLTDTIKLNAAQIFKRIGDKLGYEIELRTA